MKARGRSILLADDSEAAASALAAVPVTYRPEEPGRGGRRSERVPEVVLVAPSMDEARQRAASSPNWKTRRFTVALVPPGAAPRWGQVVLDRHEPVETVLGHLVRGDHMRARALRHSEQDEQLPPVDLSRVNPVGFKNEPRRPGLVLSVGARRPADEVRAELESLAGRDITHRTLRRDRRLPPRIVRAARRAAGVVDHPALHSDALAHASTLVQLAASAAPVVSRSLPADVAELLGPRLTEALQAGGIEDLFNPVLRERRSIAQRRAALVDHGPNAGWQRLRLALGVTTRPAPTVSVLLTTKRVALLPQILRQISRQDYPNFELVLTLHGDEFPSDIAGVVARHTSAPVQIVQVAQTVAFGEALNRGVAAASGSLLVKMDDDDWYGPHHITDLVLAREYSGAELVGKGSEFVYLAALDMTLRRFSVGAESWRSSIAGAALLISRHDLHAVGGWRPVRRAVDRRLVDDVKAVGGAVYRTHGFGFVANRHEEDHTWPVDVGYFLRQSGAQWRGLPRDLIDLD